MPSGYTAGVQDGKITELKDYVLMCARNFGACIHMREVSLNDNPKLREVSDYHLNRLIESNKKLEQFYLKTDEDFQSEIEEWIVSENKEREKSFKRRVLQKQRYEDMLEKVKNWETPTDEHNSLKKFCIEQLEGSIDFDCSLDGEYLKPVEVAPSVDEWRETELDRILRNIEYHTKGHKEELEKCKEVNKWITDLYNSL